MNQSAAAVGSTSPFGSSNGRRDNPPAALRFVLSKFGLGGNRQKEQMIMFYYLTELLQLSRQSVFYRPQF